MELQKALLLCVGATQPVAAAADAALFTKAKPNFFFAIKEEDSGHFVTLTKRMFTQKIWQSFDGYFRDDAMLMHF